MIVRRRHTLALLLAAGTALATWATGVAPASAAGGPGPATATARTAQAAAYWTPTRMRSARSLDVTRHRRGTGDRTAHLPVAAGAPRTIPAAAAVGETAAAAAAPTASAGVHATGNPWSQGRRVSRTTGKIFFTVGARAFQCSGSATRSRNKSVVTTAGHCVHTEMGADVQNFVFIPGYRDGKAPYGVWPAIRLVTTDQWLTAADYDFDVGFAVVARVKGRTLSDRVGAQGIQFNVRRGRSVSAFGYPAVGRFDGRTLTWCSGPVVQDTLLGTMDQGLRCDMTPGASGGPWLSEFQTGKGLITSVVSYTYDAHPGVVWGPYFGSAVEMAYDRAARVKVTAAGP